MRGGPWLTAVAVVLFADAAAAQTISATRLAVLQAEDRRASSATDLARLRTASRSLDAQTARIALRALGRLERPALIPDILPALRHRLPETRAEAANAAAQAAQGWRAARGAKPAEAIGQTPTSVLTALAARLEIEDDANVRAAICESIGRLPYRNATDVVQAETELLDLADRSASVADRLGAAKGLEALIRLSGPLQPPSQRAVGTLKALVGVPDPRLEPTVVERQSDELASRAARPGSGSLRDARVRRLALEALTTAGAVDDDVVGLGASDPDPQVRRLALRASGSSGRDTATLHDGIRDPSGTVRLEALRALRTLGDAAACPLSITMTSDSDEQVALVALDQLADCGEWHQAVTLLETTAEDASRIVVGRAWQRPAHAIVSLGRAAPDRARAAVTPFVSSETWQLRMYAARAATEARDEGILRTLARDSEDNVVEAAIDGLAKVAGSEADEIFVAALTRPGLQAIRAAAIALDGTSHPATAVPALKAAQDRLTTENRADSEDTRAAIASTLAKLGTPPAQSKASGRQVSAERPLTAEALQRLAAPRARVIIRDVGSLELALFTSEAPSTVLRFAELAESGYYNGLTFHRILPNLIVQGGSAGANEYVDHRDRTRDEVGLWPNVRGTVGLFTHGRDTGGAQFFVNLVDNPAFDHEYTVFAQVLNGIEIVDRILEGDVIERVEIIP